ncbi:MAG: gluconate 2-dehydrogenase subunit 3 family protein [Rhizobiales bacterium]|nr:gluconate 2-dehydrogenase subunit 3 family protein [Hyphomicrobiales bacterium]
MRLIDRTPKISRRTLLRTGSMTAAAAAMAPATVVTGKAWAAAPVAVSADTHATLVKMARDIYPHDKLTDQHYAKVIDGLDAAAKDDVAGKDMLEKGVAQLDGISERMGHGKYAASSKEEDRIAVLKEIEKQDGAFFHKIRGSLVTGIYNNPEVWPIFGYEGESASQGGYISRGFGDINWLT